jgi:hypothetical protein
MIPVRHPDATTKLVGSKAGFTIRAARSGGWWVSLWEPSEADAALLARGGHVELWVGSEAHPSVRLRAVPRFDDGGVG